MADVAVIRFDSSVHTYALSSLLCIDADDKY